MRLLITGGAGFLGSHLADHFLARGDSVTVFDNLITGRVENIQHLFENPRFTFIKQDVTDYVHVAGKLDAVLHFASPASPVVVSTVHVPIAEGSDSVRLKGERNSIIRL